MFWNNLKGGLRQQYKTFMKDEIYLIRLFSGNSFLATYDDSLEYLKVLNKKYTFLFL